MPRRTCQTLIAPIAAVVAGAWLTTAVGAQAPRQATSRTLRARIVADESGQQLPNARVVVEGTATTVRADFEGRVVVAAAPTATLRVRKAGYVPQEIAVSRWRDEIRLIRAVAIAGQITNDRGEPVPSATVTATPRDSAVTGNLPVDVEGKVGLHVDPFTADFDMTDLMNSTNVNPARAITHTFTTAHADAQTGIGMFINGKTGNGTSEVCIDDVSLTPS